MAPTNEQQALFAALRNAQAKIQNLEKSQQEVTSLLRQVSAAPKWVEEIPGKRSPFFAVIDITVAANSTARVEGTYTVSMDGPFACVGIAMYFQRTSSPYNGIWSPASTLEARISPTTQGVGFGYLFDQPVLGSFDVEISESGTDRNWQNAAFASAIFAPSLGGVYVLPVSNLFGRNSVAIVKVSPTVEQTVAGKVQVILLGYKIIQGDTFQP